MRVPRRRFALVVALVSAVAGVGGLVATPAHGAAVINVPASQPTIQAAVDAASDGDIVLVAAGTYFEHIDFKGKAIAVRSSGGLGAPAAKAGPGSTLSVQVTGRGGVPATGVKSVVLNVTVTEPTAPSWLTVWPAGAARPLASNLNYVAHQTVPNLVVVDLGADGKVDLYNAGGSTHVIADVAGWFAG